LNHPYLAPALASLFAIASPAQAQTGLEAFNPMAMLAPMMTPFGLMMVPNAAPNTAPMNGFNPAALFNPAMFNPAMFNPAMLPTMPGMQAPQGMIPFTGMQAAPQAYGMPTQMPNPFAGVPQPMANPFTAMPQQMANPFATMPQFPMPAQSGFPAFPGFPGFPFPAAR
jgi:hypothetical protein